MPPDQTPRQFAMDGLDGLLDVLNLTLQVPGDTRCLPRTTLERWARQAGRALLYLTELDVEQVAPDA